MITASSEKLDNGQISLHCGCSIGSAVNTSPWNRRLHSILQNRRQKFSLQVRLKTIGVRSEYPKVSSVSSLPAMSSTGYIFAQLILSLNNSIK